MKYTYAIISFIFLLAGCGVNPVDAVKDYESQIKKLQETTFTSAQISKRVDIKEWVEKQEDINLNLYFRDFQDVDTQEKQDALREVHDLHMKYGDEINRIEKLLNKNYNIFSGIKDAREHMANASAKSLKIDNKEDFEKWSEKMSGVIKLEQWLLDSSTNDEITPSIRNELQDLLTAASKEYDEAGKRILKEI